VRTPALLELLPLPRTTAAGTSRDALPSRLLIFQSDGSAAPKEARRVAGGASSHLLAPAPAGACI
jgi:hypothetical protein